MCNTLRLVFAVAKCVLASKCSRNHFISEKYKTVQLYKLHFIQNIPLCNYTFLPATVKVWETFLETISWKPFRLFRRICNGVSSITKVPSLHCCFQSREQVKISWSQPNVSVLSYCSLLRNRRPKPTSVLEHCREWKTNCWFPIFRGVSFWSHPSGDEGYQCQEISLVMQFL